MKLIVGLGNPEKKYEKTFHNLGFMCVDYAVNKLGESFSKTKCRAHISEFKIGREKVIFAKPQTYMNLSGESVRELLSFYKIDLSDLIVVYDDFDLEKGAIRIRESGSAGTHNGMRNIIELLGRTDFPHVRVGFKPDVQSHIPLIDLVLSGIKEEDKALFDNAIARAGDAIIAFANGAKIQDVMQKYNGKAK